MTIRAAVVAQGGMGSAVGERLAAKGVDVLTVLAGRSPASAARAAKAGMRPAAMADLAGVDFVLSIVPPGAALDFAEAAAPILAAAARKPVFADCNAVGTRTLQAITATIAGTGARFVDASIMGGPPYATGEGPVIYASGEAAADFARLRDHGLDIRPLDGPVGAASALKMCYAAFTKGFTGLAAVSILAASRGGASAALAGQLKAGRPDLYEQSAKQVPRMLPKAYRFVAEMQEIADFLDEDDPAANLIYRGMAMLYQRIADDLEGAGSEAKALGDFFR